MTSLSMVIGAYVGALLAMLGGFAGLHILRQLPWQVYAYEPFDAAPAPIEAAVRRHRRPARYDLVTRRLAPVAVLIDNLTAPMRGIA